MPKPKKYSEGLNHVSFLAPNSIFRTVEDYAKAHKLSKTDVILSAITLLTTPELNETLNLKAENKALKERLGILEPQIKAKEDEDQQLKSIQKLSAQFEITKFMDDFDNSRISNYASLKINIDRLSDFFKRAKFFGLEDEIVSALEIRLQFLYGQVTKDLTTHIYTKGKGKYQDSLWYTFNDFVNNGYKTPPIPEYFHIKDSFHRESYKQSKSAAKLQGLPYSEPRGKLLGATIKETPRLELKPKKKDLIEDAPLKEIHDSEFDNLMGGADE